MNELNNELNYDEDKLLDDVESEEDDAAAAVEAAGKKTFTVSRSEGAVSGLFDWVKCLLFAIAIVVVCLTFAFRLVDVDGTSMYDTLESGDKVIVTNLFYTPKVNDIVVISHGVAYDKPIIKRVIATAGQTIELDYENDRLVIDGVVCDESEFIDGSTFAENIGNYEIPYVVPEGKIFVMGDNRKVSKDSRNSDIGLIDVESVIGKAQLVVFPFDNFGYLY